MVKAAGVVGMGGAGFPTGVKLGTDLQGGYILVNAAECEPDFVITFSSWKMTVRKLSAE